MSCAAFTLTASVPRVARAARVDARRTPTTSSWNASNGGRGGRAVFAFGSGRACRAQRLRMRTALTRVESSGDEEESTGGDAAVNAEGGLKDNQVQLPMPRRRAELTFTCNKCEQRGTRMVNPEVYKKGTLFVQCPNPDCAVWHKIVDNLGLIYEFKDDVEEDA